MTERFTSYDQRKEFKELITNGRTAYKERDYASGIEYFKQALEIDPNHIYAKQCVSQAYLMNGDYLNAKPLCVELIHEGELSGLSLRKFKNLADENNDPSDDLVLEQYIRIEAYEQIQKMCRASKEQEKEAYLKMRDIFKEQGCQTPFRWYSHMIHNRINCKNYKDAWDYLEEAELKIKNYSEFSKYTSLLYKYALEVGEEEEYPRLLKKANILLDKDQYDRRLLELKEFIYRTMGMETEQKELLTNLKTAYEKILDEETFDLENKHDVRKRLYFIRNHSALAESAGLPQIYEHEIIALTEKKKQINEKNRNK